MKKAALISVSNRDNLAPFAKALADAGYTLLTTTGSGAFLQEQGLEVTGIEGYTGQKEILGGRVKTLHPKIHAGLLARRDDPEHMKQLEEDGILPIDIAVINLYPFIEHLSTDSIEDPAKMIELVDIGGPTMIRAASKNYNSVLPVIDPADYDQVSAILAAGGLEYGKNLELRRKLATKVFTRLAEYNLEIAKYFSNVSYDEKESSTVDSADNFQLGPVTGKVLERSQELRYGENPKQKGAFYTEASGKPMGFEQHGGKDLSYNNFLDFDAALGALKSLPREKPGVVIIKHLNPCGAAIADSLVGALRAAKTCDARSHFGGIIAFNKEVDAEVAEAIREDFAEIILAPSYSDDARAILAKSKNLRVLTVSLEVEPSLELRSVNSGVLIQESDQGVSDVREIEVASEKKPTEAELEDLQLAWSIIPHVRSNAITIVKNGLLVGVGAGQMSRIDSTQLAISKAATFGHDIKGAVVGSDAFFPFEDGIEALAEAGVSAIVTPSGSKRDPEIVAAANRHGLALLFATERHFRH